MNGFEDWALTLLVFLPLVGAAVVVAIPRSEEGLIKIAALGFSLATLAVAIGVIADFNFDAGGDIQIS